MAATEVVVGQRVDPDFGAIECIETRTMAAVDGQPLRPLVYRCWQGQCQQLAASVLISSEGDPPEIADAVRQDYRRVIAAPDALKKDVAQRELELARDWAASGDITTDFDEDEFAAMLRIDAFTIDPARLTVWLEEDQDIFAGHAVEVRIENGAITEIGLAG